MTLSVAVKHQFPGFALDVEFEAPDGITVLFGRSGSGKTTVINSVAGLLKPHSAQISLGTEHLHNSTTRQFLPVHKRRLGYVFQGARLFPHMSVAQNLSYGLKLAAKAATGPSLPEVPRSSRWSIPSKCATSGRLGPVAAFAASFSP